MNHLTRLSAIASLFLVAQLTNATTAAESDYADLLRTAGINRGIAVHIGCGDAQQTLKLRRDNHFVVQGLDSDPVKIEAARQRIESQGANGAVSVRLLPGTKLPYIDNLINLIVAEEHHDIAEDEILRVLRPLGVAMVRQGDSWDKITKPWPDQLDEWTHFLHDPSGNAVSHDSQVGPPRRLQWTAGSLWGRSHEMNNSLPALVTARGRMYYIFDKGVTGMEDERLGEKWTLIARDAFNGSLLWQRPLTSWGSHVWRNRALRFFGGTMARRVVADGDRLYCTFDFGGDVQVLDGSTGKTIETIPDTKGTEEILVDGDHVFCAARIQKDRNNFSTSITCYSTSKSKVLWKSPIRALYPQTLIVGEGEVVFFDRESVVCLDRDHGKQRWKTHVSKQDGASRRQGRMLILADGKVVTSSRKEVTALNVANGKVLWKASGVQGSSMREYDLFFAQGKIWCSGSSGTVVGYSIKDGTRASLLDASGVQSQGHHLRCYRAKATDNFLITQFRGVEFLSLGDTPHVQNDWLRGSCTYGVMPANGLLYAPPHSCFCFSAALNRGFNALAGETKEQNAELITQSKIGKLEKGPRYGQLSPKTDNSLDDWSSYRHNARRTGSTTTSVPTELTRKWKVNLTGPLTPPVAVDGRLFVAAKDKHTIHALDAKTGKSLWTFAAEARIDSPPTIYRGLLLFGGADGFLYCISANDGELAWKRRLAPAERWLAAEGQLESVWRLHGSVAIVDGVAYCSAGRSTYVDGGLLMHAVDIKTGEVKHRARVNTRADTRVDNANDTFVAAYHIEGGNSDLLVAQGGYIYLNQMKFSLDLKLQKTKYLNEEEITKRPSINLDNKAYINDDIFNVDWRGKNWGSYDKLASILVDEKQNLGEQDTGLHLFTTSGFLDATFFSRTYWMYSKTWTGFNISNLAPKSGQLVVVGPKSTYALKAYTSRYALSPKLRPETKGYLLIADDNDNEPTLDKRAWGKDKGMGFSRGAPPLWHRWLDVRVQAMVLADKQLIVCGPPDALKPGDAMASFEGRMGSELRVLSAVDGKTLSQQKLKEVPIFDGMIAAGGQIYMVTGKSEVICLGRPAR